jgi:glycosyltransferase involved in cell wall biosynthesis
MKVSVIMSAYNAADSIENSIKSILSQSYENFEFLICNDGSIDRTNAILTKYSQEDSRIKLYNNVRNIGLTKSLNILINNSTGKVIARQDADDISFPHRLEVQLAYIKNENYEFVTSRALIKDTEKLIPGISFYLPTSFLLNFKNPFIHGTLAITKKALDKVGNYDENFYYSQDYKLFSDLIAVGIKFKNINEPLYQLNMKNNISQQYIHKQDYYAKCVRNNKIPNAPS